MRKTNDDYELPIFEDTDMEDLNLYSTEMAAALTLILSSGIFDGKSAYQVWLDAGNQGTVDDFLESLTGPQGPPGPVAGVKGNAESTYRTGNVNITKEDIGLGISDIMNIFYPIGSYYETSDSSFNPNTAWGGTWVQDTAGKSTIAVDSNDTDLDTVGNTVGVKSNLLTMNNIPSHTHSYDKSATSTGTNNGNTGSTTLTVNQIPSHTHAVNQSGICHWVSSDPGLKVGSGSINAKFNDSVTTKGTGGGQGHTHTLGNHGHSISLASTATSSAGSSTPDAINNLQPSVIVIRWHRTA